MSDDGEINYSSYSMSELRDALEHIDQRNYPANYRNLLAAIEMQEGESVSPAKDDVKSEKKLIPVGSHGLIELPLDKKYIAPFRVVMLLIASPFALEAYDVLVSGFADNGSYVLARGEDWGYYAHLAKYASLALLFLWLGSFGVKDKATVIHVDEP